jgi:hypothetical protein
MGHPVMIECINKATAACLAIIAVLLICTNSTLHTTAYSVTLSVGHQERDARLDALAGAIDERQLRPPSEYVRFAAKPALLKISARGH